MTEPCKRHKADKSVDPDWMPVSDERGTRWAIMLIDRCKKCGNHMRPRVLTYTIRATQREALEAWDPKIAAQFFPPEATPAPRKSKPVTVPGSGWPFPVSAHVEPGAPPAPARRRKVTLTVELE